MDVSPSEGIPNLKIGLRNIERFIDLKMYWVKYTNCSTSLDNQIYRPPSNKINILFKRWFYYYVEMRLL